MGTFPQVLVDLRSRKTRDKDPLSAGSRCLLMVVALDICVPRHAFSQSPDAHSSRILTAHLRTRNHEERPSVSVDRKNLGMQVRSPGINVLSFAQRIRFPGVCVKYHSPDCWWRGRSRRGHVRTGGRGRRSRSLCLGTECSGRPSWLRFRSTVVGRATRSLAAGGRSHLYSSARMTPYQPKHSKEYKKGSYRVEPAALACKRNWLLRRLIHIPVRASR